MPLEGSNCFVCGKTPLEFLLRDGYPGEVLFGKNDGFCHSIWSTQKQLESTGALDD